MLQFGHTGNAQWYISCVLNMLSSAYVWSHDLLTHGLVQHCGKIMKNRVPSYSFHYIFPLLNDVMSP